MNLSEMAKELVINGKGIFAADASPETIGKRLAEANIKIDDAPGRRKYREVLFTTKGLGQYVGGVIMHDESIRQKGNDGQLFTASLEKEGVNPGIKVDKGAKTLVNFTGEKITEGLDGLRERLTEYYQLGARLTKWRAVINIDDKLPTRTCVEGNAHQMAIYALLSQEAGMVPIVEPEVLMDGNHSIERCQEVTEMVGRIMFETLIDYRVDLAGILYKTNMVVAGRGCSVQPGIEEVAKRTVETLRKTVSVRVPGVVFLSGGQNPTDATKRLNTINQMGAGDPWRWTFSFERALEGPVMKIWQGKDENKIEAQKALLHRAKMNSLASLGKYKEEMENEV